MNIIDDIKTYLQQKHERKVFKEKLGINGCMIETSIYGFEELCELNITPQQYKAIIEKYIDEIAQKILNDAKARIDVLPTIGMVTKDATQGIGFEELKEKLLKEFNNFQFNKYVKWEESRDICRILYNRIYKWIYAYGVDALLENSEYVKAEIRANIDEKVFYAKKYKTEMPSKQERKKAVYLSQNFSQDEIQKYNNLEVLEKRLFNLLKISENKEAVNELLDKLKNISDKKLPTIQDMELLDDIYLAYEEFNRSSLINTVFCANEDKVITNKSELENMLVHFFTWDRGVNRFENEYRESIVERIKHRTGKLDEKYFSEEEKEEIETAMLDFKNIKSDVTKVNNTADLELTGSCGIDYSVRNNVSNLISASVVKSDILRINGISIGVGFDSAGVQLENIATISDHNIYSNKGLDYVANNDEFDVFSNSVMEMISDEKRNVDRNEVVMFRNMEDSTLKPSYFLCVCNLDVSDENVSSQIDEYKNFAKARGLKFVLVDAYQINKNKENERHIAISMDR